MTITNYTFFSPNGNDFPVTSNADGQLYQMLTGMKDGDYRIKDSTPPLNTALNRVYTNTSMVVGGRYFELKDHSITLKPTQTNFIHAVINIADFDNPVTITVEDANNSNRADVNNTSNVLKVCFEIVATSGSTITSVNRTSQVSNIDVLNITGELVQKTKTVTFPFGYGVTATAERVGNQITLSINASNTSVIQSGTTMNEKIPAGYRPKKAYSIDFTTSGTSYCFYNIGTNGSIQYGGNSIPINSSIRGVRLYYTSEPFPT